MPRIRALPLLVALAALLVLAPLAGARTWHRVSPTEQSSNTQIGVLRNADGSMTVAALLRGVSSPTAEDVVLIPMAANGAVGTTEMVASSADWTILTSPAIIRQTGGPVVYFGGANGVFDGLWSVDLSTGALAALTGSGNTATSGAGFASAAATAAGGLATWSSTFGLASQPLDSAAAAVQGLPLTGCCAYNANVAVQASGGTWVFYDSNATGATGRYAQRVDPATGAAIGTPVAVPKTLVDGGYDFPIQSRVPVAVVGARVYTAWAQGYPTTNRLALWRVGTAAPKRWDLGYTVTAVGVARTPTGALWLHWADKSTGVLYARRSNSARTSWGPVIRVGRPFRGAETIYKTVGDAMRPGGKLDLFASAATFAGKPTWYHTLVAP